MTKFVELMKELLPIITQFLQENDDSEQLVVNYLPAKELKAILQRPLTIPSQGQAPEEFFAEIKEILKYSVRTGHRHFFNQLYTRADPYAFAGEWLATVLNASMATYEVAPVGTLLETSLIEKMLKLVGFSQGDGIFVPGGSSANMVGMLCARNELSSMAKFKGLSGQQTLVAFVSDEAHYSYQKAANIIGIGTHNLISVPSDEIGRMDVSALKKKIQAALAQGQRPFFIGATSGTTVTGAFDPIEKIAAVAAEFQCWLHVDAAFGGGSLLSPSHRSLLNGVELADSLTWDAHKTMGVPLTCSAILVRQKGVLDTTCSGGGGEYLFHDYENAQYDLGPKSLQCGRRIDALKLWALWKHYGDQGLAERIERLFTLAEYGEKVLLRHAKHLELVVPRQSYALCFRFRSPNGGEENALNLRLRETLARRGKFLINYSTFKGQVILRAVFLSPETQESDIDQLIEHIIEIGCMLLKENSISKTNA